MSEDRDTQSLPPEDVEAQNGELLPDREAMSLVNVPGAEVPGVPGIEPPPLLQPVDE
jgi:hypothetical protein